MEENIKKILLPKSQFPPFTSFLLNDKKIRFRLVSQDRSQVSDWSQIYTISSGDPLAISLPKPIIVSSTTVNFQGEGSSYKNFTASWYELPGLPIKEFDIFVRKNGTGSFEYWNTTTTQNFSALFLASEVTSLDVVVQISTYSKVYRTDAIIFSSVI